MSENGYGEMLISFINTTTQAGRCLQPVRALNLALPSTDFQQVSLFILDF